MALRFAALIPCYNVSSACVPVIREASIQSDLCVAVDDGSTDHTYAQMQTVSAANVTLLRHEHNRGKGAALMTGFRYLLNQQVDGVVTLDGDGQHDPSQIRDFIREYNNSRAALICGNRMADQRSMPFHRRLLNRLSTRVMSSICHRRILDSQCGFRFYSRALLEKIIDQLETGRYELETEILIKASRMGLEVRFVPVQTIYSPETSKLSHHNLYDVLRIARLLTYWFFHR